VRPVRTADPEVTITGSPCSRSQKGPNQPPSALSAHILQLGSSSLLVLSFPVPEDDALAALTTAEREVATLVASGATNLEISRRRGVSKNTVANQVAAILRKTKASSRFELIALLAGFGNARTG
jgi:DNA-binding CsgD family transcriptional regulator